MPVIKVTMSQFQYTQNLFLKGQRNEGFDPAALKHNEDHFA